MKPHWFWTLDPDLCVGCGICADLCHAEALAHPPEAALPAVIDGRCVGCGVCVRECPTVAIVVRREDAEHKQG